MGYNVIVIGDMTTLQIYNPLEIVMSDDISVMHFRAQEDAHSAVARINMQEGLKAYLHDEYIKLANYEVKKYHDLDDVSYKELISEQCNKDEQFYIHNNKVLSQWTINNEEVEDINKANVDGAFCSSSTGHFLLRIINNCVVCYVKGISAKFTDYYFEETVQNVMFSRNDLYMIVHTTSKTFIIDFYRGKTIKCIDKENVAFDIDESKVHFIKSGTIYDILLDSLIACKHKWDIVETSKDQMLCFADGKVQRVIYKTSKVEFKKTQANISKIDFRFSDNMGFAYITKKVNEKYIYTFEGYDEKSIYLINLDCKLVDYKTSDTVVSMINEKGIILLYEKKKTSYVLTKQIEKCKDSLIALCRSFFCIFDYNTENLEFYDNGELKSVYLQRGCTNLEWSTTGLYLACISRTSGFVQLFNCDGKLLFKRIFNVYSSFIWRPFIELPSTLEHKIDEYDLQKYVEELSIRKNTNYDIDSMVSEWKSFLIKKQRLLYNK